ncbi:MAG: hypothetical protein H6Q72_208 [Firmicutes bacterium]|nr:hypothetical protein [Bacillota bacterium]
MVNTEAELKLRLTDPGCLSALLQDALLHELSTQPPRTELLETTYYDTADQRLLHSRLSYRLRLAAGEWTATVKADGTSDGGLHERAEYNIPVDNPLPSIEPFEATEIGPRLIEAVQGMPLEPVFITRFERHIVDITTPDGSTIELALDDGEIIAGDKQQKLLELELELKTGHRHALIWLGSVLAEKFPLLPEHDSKLYRAMVLAGLAKGLSQDEKLPCPLKKSSGALPAKQAFSQTIIHNLHVVIRAQQAYLTSPDEVDNIHDFRVALRRLRAQLQLAKPLLPPEDYTAWQDKLTAWSRKLGKIRDLDVFRLNWDELAYALETNLSSPTNKLALTALITDKCQAARAELYPQVAAGQFTPVLLGLWAFLETWPVADETEPTCKKFVLDRLTHWLTQFLEQGDTLTMDDLAAAHELRIACKRLRYALDSLSPVLPDNTRLLTRRLEQLQDVLGSIQDVTFTPPLLQELVKASASRLAHHNAGLITGWQLARATTAIASWETTWLKVKKAAAKAKKLKPREEAEINKRSPEL